MKNHSFLVILMLVLLTGSFADARYSGGTGEPNDPYRISTDEDLNDIGNHQEDWSKHFILINDVNLVWYTGTQFRIIGNNTTKFTGVFNGNNYKILNFTWTSSDRNCIGLFSYLGSGGQIKNLGMENVDVNAVNGGRVGGLVGANSGTITNCYSTGSITGNWEVGGMVGSNYEFGLITNCYSTGSVSGVYYVGGLVGENRYGTITNCHSTGSVTGNGEVGGLVGENYGNLSGEGVIANCYSTGSVSGKSEISGLAGQKPYGAITNCCSKGSVLETVYVGGLVGDNDGIITDSYCTGSVTGNEFVGGLVGYHCGVGITACYSTGSVSGDNFVGGMVGFCCAPETILVSFWDTQTSGWETSDGGRGKTTFEMKRKSTFTYAGWDFVNIWDICERTHYPRLRWQIPAADFLCPYGVDFTDFAVLSSAWQSKPNDSNWRPACDISKQKDNLIDELDLAIFCENWLEGM